ncbi:MAG: hypothetical protein KF861_22665 [Planctomycetaceae bacterium]|nr:hypothetical protein [Planctomycetaceae bacterium]
MGRLVSRILLLTAAMLLIGAALFRTSMGDDAGPATPGTTSPDDATIIRELFAQLEAQQEEIFSARVAYRWCLTTHRKPEHTPEHVRAVIDSYDLLGSPDSLRDLVFTLHPEPTPPDPPYETRTFYMLGDKRRADTSDNGIQLVDSDHEMIFEGVNSQLTIDHRSKSSVHLTSVEDFRCYPPVPREGLRAENFRIIEQTDDQLTIEMLPPPDATADFIPSRYTFDRATGVMTHYTQWAYGQLDREVWQRALTEYPGGIVMPALRIATAYRDGALSALRVFIIEEAEYNGHVEEDRFVMPVAEGTVLVDGRFPEAQVHRTKVATDDVRSILVPVSLPTASVASSGGPRWQLVWILNGIALIVIATVLWRRASLSPAGPQQGRAHHSESS